MKTIEEIQSLVAQAYAIPRETMLSADRSNWVSESRHVAIYLCWTWTDNPKKRIAAEFNRGYVQAWNSWKLITDQRKLYRKLEAKIAGLENQIK